MDSLKVTGIYIYPVKSLGGISLSSSRVMGKGLEYDRRWMLIDEQNACMTQRVYPKMALFQISLNDSGITIRYDADEINVPSTHVGQPINATVWNDHVLVHEVSIDFSNWFSKKLSTACRFVSFPEQNARAINSPQLAHHVSLADAYPFLIIGESSLADLNARLKKDVPMNRFRPNIVFSGAEPFEEDNWNIFAIGKNKFQRVKPCSRCVLTTVDQELGIKTGVEPLATLASYRKHENNVWFGQNLIALDEDLISVGDTIVLSE